MFNPLSLNGQEFHVQVSKSFLKSKYKTFEITGKKDNNSHNNSSYNILSFQAEGKFQNVISFERTKGVLTMSLIFLVFNLKLKILHSKRTCIIKPNF